ncbi:hypothetical protein RvY_11055 [Ramazzottius varieornatus]|uniref:Uncharacterized protein n=1 Tax=Ramazzottius varieornatus TaxID=947166 RepID=A0A1D1VKA2_RAMVA|nr:hypothetical protein RvY_11055 [Ramazzottius varieornatus]
MSQGKLVGHSWSARWSGWCWHQSQTVPAQGMTVTGNNEEVERMVGAKARGERK